MAYYTGIARNTKDLDLFIRPQDRDRTLTTLTAAGYRTEFFYPFWIAKALCGEAFIDLLYNSGNGLCPVDDDWQFFCCRFIGHFAISVELAANAPGQPPWASMTLSISFISRIVSARAMTILW